MLFSLLTEKGILAMNPERLIASPVSELLPDRESPELRHLQTQIAAQLPYRQAAALLEELLPETDGLNYATTRNRTLTVGKRIEEEIRGKSITLQLRFSQGTSKPRNGPASD